MRLVGMFALAVLLPLGAVLATLMPISFPITDPRYQGLPAVLPVLGGVISGAVAGLIAFRHQSKRSSRVSALGWAGIAIVLFAFASWYLAMFIVLNLKGS
jgi:hypothetical protein